MRYILVLALLILSSCSTRHYEGGSFETVGHPYNPYVDMALVQGINQGFQNMQIPPPQNDFMTPFLNQSQSTRPHDFMTPFLNQPQYNFNTQPSRNLSCQSYATGPFVQTNCY